MTDRERWEEIRDDVSLAVFRPDKSVRQAWLLGFNEACKRLAAQERELADAQREAAQLRRIAIDAVNETDGWCREDVSIAFLCGLANEVAAIKKQRDEARSELAEARRRVKELEDHNGKLRSFAREVIGVDGEWWPNLDGGDIQDWAEEHGLVYGEPWDPDGKHADEPIDNHYDLEPGDMVYFESDVLIGPKRSREELRGSDD